MKIRKKAVFLISIAVVSLAACGIRSDRSVSSGEIIVPEVSSEDLLVSSLEYLLLEDTENDTESDEQQDAEDEKTNQDIQAVIYYGDGGTLALIDEAVAVEELTPEALIDALARHNIVSLDTKVLSFEQTQENGSTVLCLDLSKAFGEYLRTMSKEAECIILSAVVDTYLENYTGDAVYITVEGGVISTSNYEFTEPLERCTPAELLEMMEK
ncbi:MAG: GerMN domain-containing protein [Lachnospiraceae bacterium]|nr:GerMN domain-containing protein [Lachnospiraceae bacterium]